MFPCRMLSTQSGVRLDGLGWVPLGPVRLCQGPVWSRIGPYISRTLIRDSGVICRGSSGPVGPYRVPTGFRRTPVLARRDPSRLDGSLDCPVSVHDRCTDGVPTGPPAPCGDPGDPWRTPGGTVGPRLIGASRFGRPAAPIGVSQCYCSKTSMPVPDERCKSVALPARAASHLPSDMHPRKQPRASMHTVKSDT